MTDTPAGPPEEGPSDDSDRIADEVERVAREEMAALGLPIPEGGGLTNDEEIEALADDALLDHLGAGGEAVGFGELTDALSAWRDDVESVPPPPGTNPEAIQQIHEFTQEIDRATQPPRPPEGTPTPMAISDDAAQLLAIAQNGEVQGAINTAEQHLRDAVAALQQAQQTLEGQAAQAAALAGGSEGDNLNGMGQLGVSAISDAMSAVAMFDGETVMGPVNAFYNAVSDSAQRHQGG